jgi:hypothetical protein
MLKDLQIYRIDLRYFDKEIVRGGLGALRPTVIRLLLLRRRDVCSGSPRSPFTPLSEREAVAIVCMVWIFWKQKSQFCRLPFAGTDLGLERRWIMMLGNIRGSFIDED